MRILVVATKCPWPATDGGRLALWWMLRGLAHAGHRAVLLAPVTGTPPPGALAALRAVCRPRLIPVRAPTWPRAAWNALRQRESLGLARHRQPAIEAALTQLIAQERPEVVHFEQLQAWVNAAPVRRAGLPCVLRAQNVESALWEQAARRNAGSRPLALEAARLRRDEAAVVRAAHATLAITPDDAERLGHGLDPASAAKIRTWAPPFPAWLPAGPARTGVPAVALAGSGWWPNRDALRWMLGAVAPALFAAAPDARLHLFGGASIPQPGVDVHAAPTEAVDAFPSGAIAAVPLLAGSGIRMRILEAWARGLPVVATSAAARGLGLRDGEALRIADDAHGFAAAITALQRDPAQAAALVAEGRARLGRHHDPARQTAALLAHYRTAGATG
jgi:hypothetical protein